MKTKDLTRSSVERTDSLSEALESRKELAQRVVKLERRAASQDVILKLLKAILDQMKEPGRLQLTDEQHSELNRWLADYEMIADGGLPKSEIN